MANFEKLTRQDREHRSYRDAENNQTVQAVEVDGAIEGSFAPSGLKNGGQDTLITITDSAWIKLERSATTNPIGSGIISERNSLKVTNKGTVNIATTINEDPNGNSQAYEVGDVIYPNNSQFLDVADEKPNGDPINIWVRSSSGNVIVFFREIA